VTVRVLLVDDHDVVRSLVAALIAGEPDLEIVAEAADGADALAKAGQLRPDVAVLDLSLGGESGLDLAAALRAACPAVRLLMLSAEGDRRYVRQALAAGASGYVLKDAVVTELVPAIRAVAQGDRFLGLPDPAK